MENPKQISCKISLELDCKIKEYLEKHEIKTTSDLVKSAIEYFLEQEPDTKKDSNPYHKSSIYKRPQEELDRENQIKNELEPKLRKDIIVEFTEHLKNEDHSIGTCSLCNIRNMIHEHATKKLQTKLNDTIFMNKNTWFENGIKWKAKYPQFTVEQAYQKALVQGVME